MIFTALSMGLFSAVFIAFVYDFITFITEVWKK